MPWNSKKGNKKCTCNMHHYEFLCRMHFNYIHLVKCVCVFFFCKHHKKVCKWLEIKTKFSMTQNLFIFKVTDENASSSLFSNIFFWIHLTSKKWCDIIVSMAIKCGIKKNCSNRYEFNFAWHNNTNNKSTVNIHSK